MIYDLWDVETGNIVDTYPTEADALAAVRDLLADNGPDYAQALSLGRVDERGQITLIAEGEELTRLAALPVARPRGRADSIKSG